jgi:hypothetical protein
MSLAANLLVVDQDVRLFDGGFHRFGLGDEVGADVAPVELHPLDVFRLEFEALAFLDRDHAVLADLVHDLGDQVADLGVGGRCCNWRFLHDFNRIASQKATMARSRLLCRA